MVVLIKTAYQSKTGRKLYVFKTGFDSIILFSYRQEALVSNLLLHYALIVQFLTIIRNLQLYTGELQELMFFAFTEKLHALPNIELLIFGILLERKTRKIIRFTDFFMR